MWMAPPEVAGGGPGVRTDTARTARRLAELRTACEGFAVELFRIWEHAGHLGLSPAQADAIEQCTEFLAETAWSLKAAADALPVDTGEAVTEEWQVRESSWSI